MPSAPTSYPGPLVNADEVIMPDGSRLSDGVNITAASLQAALAAGAVPVGALTPSSPAIVPQDTPFAPHQVIWLIELTCDNAGSAVVTLSGVRRDDASTETVATYSLAAGETLIDANDSSDHGGFSWAKTGTGAVTVRVL